MGEWSDGVGRKGEGEAVDRVMNECCGGGGFARYCIYKVATTIFREML